MYQRIADDLIKRIESGAIPPGSKLPTELQLRDQYEGAARNTVRNAIRLVSVRGLVENRRGLGTFVTRHVEPIAATLLDVPQMAVGEMGLADGEAEAPFTRLMRPGRTPTAAGLQVGVQPAPDDVAAQLNVPRGTHVVSRRHEYFMDSVPWSLLTTYYPRDLVTERTPALVQARGIPGGAASYLEQRLGLVQVGYRERILARPAAPDEARFLQLPGDGSATVLTVMDTRFGPNPFQVTILVMSAERNELVINSGTVPDAHAAAQWREPGDVPPDNEGRWHPVAPRGPAPRQAKAGRLSSQRAT
jgi:GntR family transcriptional regulator